MAASILVHAVLLASVPDPAPARWGLAVRRFDAQLVARPGASPVSFDTADPPAKAVAPPVSEARPAMMDIERGRRGARAGQEAGERARPAAKVPAKASEIDAPADAAAVPQLDNVGAEALRQYRIELALAARSFNAYPDIARARDWQGTVEVVLEASVRSPKPRALLLRSSGYPGLDAQAVDMLTRAALATPLPDVLKARDFRVVVAVRFDLDDGR